MEPVKRTPLFGLHRELGAKITEFGGFEMPLCYSGIIEEHRAVRTAAGLFDLSHMGEFEVSGSGALALLERTLTNSAARLADGQAQYTIMCAEDGGTIDDLIVYRRGPGRYMMCVNASNIAADWEWLLAQNHDAKLRDNSDETALIAVQGPRAIRILQSLTPLPLDSVKRFHAAESEVASIRCLLARTGYTGEDGFELFCVANDGSRLFHAILAAGQAEGIKPCGLGARDTLRMEAGLPLYGHELDRITSPLEAGLATIVKFGHGFIGEQALAAQQRDSSGRHLIGIRTTDGRTIARQGYKIYRDGQEAGVVTSGTFAPSFDRPLAMAYLNHGLEAAAGTRLEVAIRNRMAEAEVVALPFYRRPRTVQ
ncbi:MAG TPA: glycine cleavage system aminomethyltransferase GcvT [Candidatus Binataceae bacterium]|nr:glycine cleavage system aminomethyltransferase GcvT [Candidatus Binataceae bacterium]